MSIIALADASSSGFHVDDFRRLAGRLGIHVSDDRDAHDYLRLLWSFESVLSHVERAADYIPPQLQPLPTVQPREYWAPSAAQNPYNAWSHQCNLSAAAPSSHRLQGRAVAIKDNICIAGLPTTLGAPASILSDQNEYPVSPIDATVVSRILAAGGTIKGTSTCECFCASPLSFTSASGPVHNPHLHGYTSGGSSSGSCALVAAHALYPHKPEVTGETVELAIGSDQAGSVRIPASYCGLLGLKPTFGLVPYTGAASMMPMIDHLGPIATHLKDIALLLEVMAGYDGLDSRMSPESPLVDNVKPYQRLLEDFQEQLKVQPETARVWRIGLLTEAFSMLGVSSLTVIEAATKAFEAAGATVVPISIPMHREAPIIWTAASRPSMSKYLYQASPAGHLSFAPPHLRPHWPLTQQTFESISATNPALANILFSSQFTHDHVTSGIEAKAHRKVFELRAVYDRALEDVDVLVTPCAPSVTMPLPSQTSCSSSSSNNKLENADSTTILKRLESTIGVTNNTCPFNVTGHPAMSVPCGFGTPSPPRSAEDASSPPPLPIGMQIIGKRWQDEKVIMAAALFQWGRELIAAGNHASAREV
ncbi:LOW QUALITY PROTEIN: amidase signature domain-containing protein [Bipolaris maydis]|nr:LOW QUALITY PROTEIN: amidase signature domain-containing protein [Bipolaris maydis]